MADKKIVDLTQSQTIADSDYVFVNQSGEPVWVPASKVKSYASGDITGGTTDYTSLTNKPQIGGVELVGNKTLDQLGIQPKIAEVLEEEVIFENPIKTAKVVAEQEVVAPKVSANQVEAGNLYKKTEIDTMVDAKIDKNQGSGNSGKYLRVGSDGNVELVNAPSGGGSGTGTSDYNDLTNKPQINGVSLNGNKTLDQLGIQAKGNYLTSIPDVYVTESELGTKVDKNQGTLNSGKYLAVGTDGNVELVDAPSGGGGGTSNYNSLTNRPQINGVTLTGNKTAADLNLQAAGDYLTSVPKATSAVYGGIKAATATASDTVPVRIKSDGTLAVATYPVLATATSTALGGIKADAKTSSDTVPVRIDASTGKLYVQTYPTSGGDGSGYVLPQATSTELGGVKATLATSAYTDEVRINSNGNLVVQAYALKASPTFTGTPKAPTASSTTKNTQIATTAFVHSLTDNKLDKNQGSTNSGKYLAVGSDGNIQYVSAPSGGGGSGTNDYESLLNRPSINGVELTGNKSLGDLGISIVPTGGSTGQVLKKTSNANGDYAWADETGGGDVDLTGYAKLASPTFTGIPKAPTASASTNTTQIATTAFVKAQGYAPLASPTFTGSPKATTATKADDSTRIATTAFVKDVVADYAPLTGAQLSNAKVNSPSTDSNDSSIANTLWVNYKLSQLDLGGGEIGSSGNELVVIAEETLSEGVNKVTYDIPEGEYLRIYVWVEHKKGSGSGSYSVYLSESESSTMYQCCSSLAGFSASLDLHTFAIMDITTSGVFSTTVVSTNNGLWDMDKISFGVGKYVNQTAIDQIELRSASTIRNFESGTKIHIIGVRAGSGSGSGGGMSVSYDAENEALVFA